MRSKIFHTSVVSLATAVLLGLSACSGGGSSDGTTTTSTQSALSGTAIDGILVGSTVFIDVNKDGVLSDGEPSTTTSSPDGKFSFPDDSPVGPLVLFGGTDLSTGSAFTGSLKAPSGSKVVTPLTSAVQSLVESGQSAADAEANVKTAMGLTGANDVNLTEFDPYEEIDGANATKAQAVLAKQTQLQVLVHSAAVTVAGAGGKDVNTTMGSVFDSIAQNFKGATAPVALDAAKVTAATKSAADSVYADNPTARVATKAIAQTSAENSVRDADNAESAISSGTPSEATGNLDAAITKVNTTAQTELAAAATTAKTASESLTPEKIAEIEALQAAQQEKEAAILAAQQEKAAAEAALAAAEAAAQAAAEDKAAYEAYLIAKAEAAAAAAAELAAEKEAALAAEAAAAEERAIAAEAEQREAEAAAAAAQAAAEEAAALLEQQAAEAAALAAQQAADLAAAQAAAEQAEADAAAAIAHAQIGANAEIAQFHATKAALDANATQVIADLDITGTAADANASTAQSAKDTATLAAANAKNLYDTNSTDVNGSIAYKEDAQVQAAIAAAALADAQQIKYEAEIAAAAQVALEAKIARITTIVSEVNATKSEAQTLFDVNGSAIGDAIDADMVALGDIAFNPLYEDAQVLFDEANVSATAAYAIYMDANDSLQLIIGAYNSAESALLDVNETAANEAKVIADTEIAKFPGYLSSAAIKAGEVAAKLSAAQAIKVAVDEAAVEAAAKAERIATMATIVSETTDIANSTLSDASAQKTDVETKLAEIQTIATQYSAAATLAQDAANVATQLTTHFATLQGYVTTINDANSSMAVAVAAQNEAAAIDANTTAATTAVAMQVLGDIVNPLFTEFYAYYSDVMDIATQNAGTVDFIANDVVGEFYSEEFVRITFAPVSQGASSGSVSFLSLVNAEDQNFTTSYSIEAGKLLVAQADGNVTTLSLLESSTADMMVIRNEDDNSTEKVYTSQAAFLASLVSFDGTQSTVIDLDNDSTGTGDGKEILQMSVRVDSTANTLVVDLLNAGSIVDELNSTAPVGYSNIVWIDINNYLEFGIMIDGNGELAPYLNKDIYTDGEFTNGIPETNYSYSGVGTLDPTLSLTIPLELLNTQEYLFVKAEVAIDENNEFNSTVEVQDDYTYDAVVFGGIWNPFPDVNTTTPSDANLTAMIAGQTLYGIQAYESNGSLYGHSMSFDDCSLSTEPICSGYSGGTDEYGAYGIDANLSDHTYEIIGDMLRVTEDGNEGQGISEIVPTGVMDDFNGTQVYVTFKDLNGTVQGNATFFVYTTSQDRDAALAAMSSSAVDNTTRTIPAIGSWYNADLGINLVIFDDAHYFMAQDDNGTGGVAGGIEIGSFTLSDNNNTLTIDSNLTVNSNEGDTAVGGVTTYNESNDTLTFTVDGQSFDFARDEATNILGAWTNNQSDTMFDALILHSDDSYLSVSIDLSSSVAYDSVCTEGSCTYNMFERGSYTASLVDTNLTVSFTPFVDYNGVFGPPADTNISFDVSGYPAITNSDMNITFDKVVQELP